MLRRTCKKVLLSLALSSLVSSPVALMSIDKSYAIEAFDEDKASGTKAGWIIFSIFSGGMAGVPGLIGAGLGFGLGRTCGRSSAKIGASVLGGITYLGAFATLLWLGITQSDEEAIETSQLPEGLSLDFASKVNSLIEKHHLKISKVSKDDVKTYNEEVSLLNALIEASSEEDFTKEDLSEYRDEFSPSTGKIAAIIHEMRMSAQKNVAL